MRWIEGIGMVSGTVPLALRNLLNDKSRFLRSTAGITFAVFLMLVQFGFQAAFVDSALGLIRNMDADIVLISTAKYQASNKQPFSRRQLYQAMAVPGVASARPIYGEWKTSFWKNPDDQKEHTIQVIGIDPDAPALLFPEVLAHLADLRRPFTVMMDRRSRRVFGEARPGLETELVRHKVEVVGMFTLGPDFVVDGTVIMSDRTFEALFPAPQSERDGLAVDDRPSVEFGAIKVVAGQDVAAVQARLRDALSPSLSVLTRQQFVDQENTFQSNLSGVGPIFNLGVAIGFAVGMMISYQILFTDISDQIAQYATLKAMGYSSGYLIKVVLQQAVLYAFFGFIPAWLLCAGLFTIIGEIVLLPMRMSLWITSTGACLTIGMCLVSGMIAVCRVIAADPAEVF